MNQSRYQLNINLGLTEAQYHQVQYKLNSVKRCIELYANLHVIDELTSFLEDDTDLILRLWHPDSEAKAKFVLERKATDLI